MLGTVEILVVICDDAEAAMTATATTGGRKKKYHKIKSVSL